MIGNLHLPIMLKNLRLVAPFGVTAQQAYSPGESIPTVKLYVYVNDFNILLVMVLV